MDNIEWLEIVGLIGVTLVIATGKIFNPLRKWLLGFSNKLNPLHWAGELISCSMCCGVWVGFLWGVFFEGFQWWNALVFGGVLSLLSLAADELLSLLILYRMARSKKNDGAMTIEEMMQLRDTMKERKKVRKSEQMRNARERRRATPRDITEEEAHAYMDKHDELSDEGVTWVNDQP